MAQFAAHRTEYSHNDFTAPTYANAFNVFWSQWDFLMSFQHNFVIIPDDSDPSYARDSVSRVVMSPQHAKALSEILLDQVKKYEAKYGKIKLVDENATND